MKLSILPLIALILMMSSLNCLTASTASAREYMDPTVDKTPVEKPQDEAPELNLEQARSKEAGCMTIDKLDEKLICLDNVTDWWFHAGGNYVDYNPYIEMTRIMKVQLALDPKQYDIMSNLAFYTFSIEVDAILNHAQTDFTDTPMKAFNDYEAVNSNEFVFYYLGLDTALPILAERSNIGSVEMKKAYYAEDKRRMAKAKKLWAAADKSKMDPAAIKSVEFNLDASERILKKFAAFDIPLAAVVPTPEASPAPKN